MGDLKKQLKHCAKTWLLLPVCLDVLLVVEMDLVDPQLLGGRGAAMIWKKRTSNYYRQNAS